MRGANGVRDAMAELLRYEVARKLPLLREVWSLDATTAPDVDKFLSGEPPDHALTSEGDVWVSVINPRLVRTVRVDIKDGLPVYMTRYSCRVYVWVRAKDWATAIAARDNTAVACRLALLEYPNLSATVHGDTGYRLHENTYTEEFGEPQRYERTGGRVMAGAVLSIDMDCEETLADGSTRPPIGSVDSVSTDITAAGADTPLPETI